MTQPLSSEPNPSYESLQARVAELEKNLQDTRAQLDSTNQELDDLVHFIAHDLRAPLRGVDGYSQALLQDYDNCLDEIGKAYLNFIRDSSRGASVLIDRLLIYLRAMRGPLQLQIVDLSDEVQHAAQELQESQPERQAVFEIVPALAAEADPRMIALLINELLNNAWKFTRQQPSPKIAFCSVEQAGQPVFAIRDNGAGFKMEYAHKLFRPFERLHGAHEFEGVGLGLAICRRIIERHQGRIWAQGAVGEGATVFFTLPGVKTEP